MRAFATILGMTLLLVSGGCSSNSVAPTDTIPVPIQVRETEVPMNFPSAPAPKP
jgi:hypothetical protein